MLLRDGTGQTLDIRYETAYGVDKYFNIFTEAEADRYKAKFGAEVWNTILKGSVKLGMTKEMCKLAWGEPKDINITTSAGGGSEQWVYRSNYLYFRNGKLTTIQ